MRVSARAIVHRCAVCAAWLVAILSSVDATAVLPRSVARAFLDQRIPLSAVGAYVQEIGTSRPLVTHQSLRPMAPASTMKLVTTFAALELLGPDYRWKTEAYANGPVAGGALDGDLVLKGHGDPKITLEQFQELIARLRATGLAKIGGDLLLDRSYFSIAPHDPAAFDGEPLRPYNVGPDALLINFKVVRFVFSPDVARDSADVRIEPRLDAIAVRGTPRLVPGDCGDWHAALQAAFTDLGESASATFAGSYPVACGERDWYVALLDIPHYALGIFSRSWLDSGGSLRGRVREGAAQPDATLLAVLESAPLYAMVSDINKLSNNVMARQVFLALANTAFPPPATTENAAEAVKHWLAAHKLRFPELVMENGSGLSRHERIAPASMGRLLLAADASKVRGEYVSSLAVAATDGTLRMRFQNDDVADQAFLKTGTLEGVRAIAGYVLAPNGKRFVVVCFVNHRNASRAQAPLDVLVRWIYDNAR